MKHANARDLKLWEIGLNDLFHYFYTILYDPRYDRSACLEAESEFRGYYTALYYSDLISDDEKRLLFNELQTMTELSFAIKPH